MTIVPKKEIDELWYLQSELTKESNPNLSTIINRVSKFERNSILFMASALSWYSWVSPRITHFDELLAFNSLFLASLGLAKGSLDSKKVMNEASFRILVGDIFNATDLNSTKNSNESEIQGAIEYYLKDHPEFRCLQQKSDIEYLKVLLVFARMGIVQWEGRSYNLGDFFRPYAIYREFRKIAIGSGKIKIEDLEKAEKIFLGTSLDRFAKSIWFLFTIQLQGISKENPLPSRIVLGAEIIPENIKKHYEMETDDFYIAVQRLAKKASTFKIDFSDLNIEDADNWIHLPEFWSIQEFPIINFDDIEDGKEFLIVCPLRLLRRLVTFVLDDIYKYLDDNLVLKDENQAKNYKGDAYEQYLRNIFVGTDIKSVDSFLPKEYKGKKCDFIWRGKHHNILIEAKVKIRPNNDRTFLNSNSFVTSSASCMEALKQGIETLKVLKLKNPTVLIIVTEENLAEITSQFIKIAKKYKLLGKSNLSGIAIFHSSELEFAVRKRTPEQVFLSIVGSWRKVDPSGMTMTFHDYDFFKSRNRWDLHPYLLSFSEEIFPGFKQSIEKNDL